MEYIQGTMCGIKSSSFYAKKFKIMNWAWMKRNLLKDMLICMYFKFLNINCLFEVIIEIWDVNDELI